MNDLGALWECDPEKNTECKKTSCKECGGPCWCTTNKDFSTGKRAINVSPILNHEYRKDIVRKSVQKRRAAFKEQGLCAYCGKVKPDPKPNGKGTYKLCRSCRLAAAEKERTRRAQT